MKGLNGPNYDSVEMESRPPGPSADRSGQEANPKADMEFISKKLFVTTFPDLTRTWIRCFKASLTFLSLQREKFAFPGGLGKCRDWSLAAEAIKGSIGKLARSVKGRKAANIEWTTIAD
jgi:hypothetical protein